MRSRIATNIFPEQDIKQTIFWTLTTTAGMLLVLYMILIQSSIYNVVVEKKYSKEFRQVQSDMLTFEEAYLEKLKVLNIDSIGQYGLVSLGKNDVHYVKAEIGSNLSLNIDGE